MPAYFGVRIEFDDTPQRESLARDFFDCLGENGVLFLRGFRKSEGFSLEQQVVANQYYINNSDSYEGSFYQAQFRFLDFTEVRGYWNVDQNEVSFSLIIPEEDFYEYARESHEILRHEEMMDAVKELCIHIWKMPSVRIIQTNWECSDCAPKYKNISPNHPPQTEPFSILPCSKYFEQWDMKTEYIDRGGVLLEKEENWLYI